MRDTWPLYGSLGALRELEARGYQRDLNAVRDRAWQMSLERAPWDHDEDVILRQCIARGMSALEVSSALRRVGWDRDLRAVADRARELGIWKGRQHTQARASDALVGGEYRDLTRDTARLIRRWYAEGDSAAYLASEMKRPLWLIKAMIAGQQWCERWEAERAARGLEASA